MKKLVSISAFLTVHLDDGKVDGLWIDGSWDGSSYNAEKDDESHEIVMLTNAEYDAITDALKGASKQGIV